MPSFASRSTAQTAVCLVLLVAVAGGCRSVGWMPFRRGVPNAPPTVATVLPTVTARPPAPVVAEPEPRASGASGLARLLQLAALREAVLLHHPASATRAASFDSALVEVLPLLRDATDAGTLTAALEWLLGALGDGAGEVRARTAVTPDGLGGRRFTTAWTTDSVLIVTAPPDGDVRPDDLAAAVRLAVLARHVILDVRAVALPSATATEAYQGAFAASGFFETLNDGASTLPSLRTLRHDGATVTWQVSAGAPLAARAVASPSSPPAPRSGRRLFGSEPEAPTVVPRRVVVIANPNSAVPFGALALVQAGRATLLAEGGVSARALVPHATLPVGDALEVTFPVAEVVHADGSTGLVADTVIAAPGLVDDVANAQRAALAIVRSTLAPRRTRTVVPYAVVPGPLPSPDTSAWPTMGGRLLAAFRTWTALRTLHVHRDLYDRDPDEVFAEVLPRVEAARDAVAFARALAPLASVLDDSQGLLEGPGADAAFGPGSAPFRIRLIEGRAIVTDVVRDPEADALGVRLGDEVVAADGFPVTAWLSEYRWLVPASNDWVRGRDLARLLARGQEREASFRIRDGATGRERQLMVPRRAAWRAALERPERWATSATRVLPGGALYVDVERATDQEVAALFAGTPDPRAVVVDLRGARVRADSVLRARLLPGAPLIGARVATRSLVVPCLGVTVRVAAVRCVQERREVSEWVQGAGAATAASLVLLVDERTQGAAERLALHLEAEGRATIVGSPTAGAVGRVVRLPLPGGLALPVTVEEVRRGDGVQVQRLGITPAIELRPTARAVRNGGDDVLERAVQWLGQQLDRAPERRR